jgi:hypothetical protein
VARSTTVPCTGLAASAAVAPFAGPAAWEAAATAAARYAISALPIRLQFCLNARP